MHQIEIITPAVRGLFFRVVDSLKFCPIDGHTVEHVVNTRHIDFDSPCWGRFEPAKQAILSYRSTLLAMLSAGF